jgi:hypothetical protein
MWPATSLAFPQEAGDEADGGHCPMEQSLVHDIDAIRYFPGHTHAEIDAVYSEYRALRVLESESDSGSDMPSIESDSDSGSDVPSLVRSDSDSGGSDMPALVSGSDWEPDN